eukprot:CAMPEP_0113895374 /NCGR_PEP_ID=MMETSP0780_2-20120614/17329_1 /TAXON_ID=652834 /ORGANISM="Palpitomonas bilix" /LENGTH=636 /DNA_ID=CAMNT_0000886201 /DNA_START=68 /DNA_END=1978 /DNA_ORIENTATION=- /assembly_acc=CAM_ASM_000599
MYPYTDPSGGYRPYSTDRFDVPTKHSAPSPYDDASPSYYPYSSHIRDTLRYSSTTLEGSDPDMPIRETYGGVQLPYGSVERRVHFDESALSSSVSAPYSRSPHLSHSSSDLYSDPAVGRRGREGGRVAAVEQSGLNQGGKTASSLWERRVGRNFDGFIENGKLAAHLYHSNKVVNAPPDERVQTAQSPRYDRLHPPHLPVVAIPPKSELEALQTLVVECSLALRMTHSNELPAHLIDRLHGAAAYVHAHSSEDDARTRGSSAPTSGVSGLSSSSLSNTTATSRGGDSSQYPSQRGQDERSGRGQKAERSREGGGGGRGEERYSGGNRLVQEGYIATAPAAAPMSLGKLESPGDPWEGQAITAPDVHHISNAYAYSSRSYPTSPSTAGRKREDEEGSSEEVEREGASTRDEGRYEQKEMRQRSGSDESEEGQPMVRREGTKERGENESDRLDHTEEDLPLASALSRMRLIGERSFKSLFTLVKKRTDDPFETMPTPLRLLFEALCIVSGTVASFGTPTRGEFVSGIRTAEKDQSLFDRLTRDDVKYLSEQTVDRLRMYVGHSQFLPSCMRDHSIVADALCGWIRSLIGHYDIKRVEELEAKYQASSKEASTNISSTLARLDNLLSLQKEYEGGRGDE